MDHLPCPIFEDMLEWNDTLGIKNTSIVNVLLS